MPINQCRYCGGMTINGMPYCNYRCSDTDYANKSEKQSEKQSEITKHREITNTVFPLIMFGVFAWIWKF